MDTDERTTQLDPSCSEVAGLIAAGALGSTLSSSEQAQVRTHLPVCALCRQRLSDYGTVTDLLLLRAPLVAPPAGLRERIVASAEQRQPAARPQQPAARPRPRASVWRWPSITWRRAMVPAFGLLAALLFGWGLGLYVQLHQQQALSTQQQAQIVEQQAQIGRQQAQAARNRTLAIAVFGNPDAQERRLTRAAAAPGAEGRALISPAAPALALYTKNLPQLAPGQVYQVWWEHEGQSLPIGTFTVDSQGRAWSLIQPPAPLALPGRIVITAEPSAGSGRPSGPVYLSAEF